MKIPKSVRIQGVEYEVQDNCPSLNDGEQMLYGNISYPDPVIRISDVTTGHEMKCLTLWHEILHGIRYANGLEVENEEAVVEMFARGIYQVLQDNGGRLFDLKEVTSDA